MMEGVESRDELADLELGEDEIDAMMAAGEPVDVVGPPDVDRRPRFEVYVDESRRYGWRLSSSDGEVLVSSAVYPTKAAALGAVEAVRRASVGAALIDRTAG
jgi:uncharacterized protein YegP (UPF0339 family)